MISTDRMAKVFVDVADVLVSDFDLLEFLHTLSTYVAEITGSEAVGILLNDLSGGLNHVASSNEEAHVLELLQLQHSEGPCVECYRTGRAIVENDLSSAVRRWPNFAPRALQLGIAVTHAFPLRLRNDVVGALNVFGREADVIEVVDISLVQSLADLATIAILQERALRNAQMVTEQLEYALNSRVVLEQAKGSVARALGISIDEAFRVIRANARARKVPMTELARAIIEQTGVLGSLYRGDA